MEEIMKSWSNPTYKKEIQEKFESAFNNQDVIDIGDKVSLYKQGTDEQIKKSKTQFPLTEVEYNGITYICYSNNKGEK